MAKDGGDQVALASGHQLAGKVFAANCCAMTVCNLDVPECIGLKQKGVCCCFKVEVEACIPVAMNGVDDRGYDDHALTLVPTFFLMDAALRVLQVRHP